MYMTTRKQLRMLVTKTINNEQEAKYDDHEN